MNLQFLPKTALFRGLREDEIEPMLHCLGAYRKTFAKGALVYRAGECVTHIGLVLSGGVNSVMNNYWSDSNIFGHMGPGQIFADAYAAIPGKELLVDIMACEPTEVLFLNTTKVMTTCPSACTFHNRAIRNLLQICAERNLCLSRRMLHISFKSIRNRLLSYLTDQEVENGKSEFTIPFSRQELANYLNVERSALSNELSKMQKDGLLSYHKNQFTLSADISGKAIQ